MAFKCEICQRDNFKNEHGLRIHKSKVHAKDPKSSDLGASAAPLTPVNEEARPKIIPSATQDRRKGEGPNGEGSSDLPSSNEKFQSTEEKKKNPITKDVEENENKPSPTRMKSSSSTTREETSEDETAEDDIRSPTGDRKDKENTMTFKCEICQKDTFKTERGLRIHKSKVHAKDRESSNVGANTAPLTPVNEEARPKDIPSETQDRRKGEGPNGEGSSDLPSSNENLQSTDEKEKPPITKDEEENENKPSTTRMKSSSSTMREETSEDETAEDVVRSPSGDRKDTENTMTFKCEICQKDTFKTARGLRIHKSKVHAKDRESSNVGASAAPLTPVNEEARPKDIPSETQDRRKGEGPNGEGSSDLPSSNENLQSTDEKEKPPITKDEEENENKPSTTRMKSSSSTMREETSEDETAEDVVRSPSGDRKDTENTMTFKCEICQKDTFKTERGLRIHKSKVHAKDRESSNVGASAAPLTPVNEEARPKDIPSATPDSRKGEGPNGEGSSDLPPSNEKLPSTDQKKKPPITKEVEENENKPSPTRMKSSSSATREETSEDETADDDVRSPTGNRKDKENTMTFKCEICQKDTFKTARGLRIHKSKVHAKDRESSNVGASAAPLTPVNEEARPKDIPSETQDRRKGEGPNGEGSSDLPSSNENLQSTDEKEKPPITKDEEENENKPSTTRMKSSSSTMREETSEDETAEDVVRSPSGDRKDTENTMAFKCEICQKDTFKTERGLRIHKSKVHAKDRESSNVGASAAPLTPVNEEARPKDIPSATPDSRKGEEPNGEGSSDLPPSNEKLPSTDQKKKPPITKEVEENENKPSPTRMKSSSSATREETSEDETADDDVRSPTGNGKDKENTMVFKCEICQKDTFKTERGLRIHKSKVHAKDRESSNVGASAAPLTPVNEEARPKDIPSETQDRRKGEGPNGEGSSDLPSSNENLQSTDEKEKPPITKDEEENENKPSTTRMKSSSSTTREETSEDETAEDDIRSPTGDRKDKENTMTFKCEICQKDTFKTERGLRIHKSKVHAKDRESSNVGANAAPLTPVNEEARPKDIPSETQDRRKGEGPNGEGSSDLPSSNENLQSTDEKEKPPITKDEEENENKPSTTRMKSSSSTMREETSEDETAEDVVRSPSGDRKDTENTMAFKCEICQKDTFKTERGLRIHKSKVHAKDRESSNVGASAAPLTPVNEEARPKDIPSATPDSRKGEEPNGEGSSDLPPSNEKLPSTDQKKKPPITKEVEENENKPSPTRMKSSSSATREETSEDETADDDVRSPTGNRKDKENTMVFKCEICQKDTFKTESGLRIHKSKVHAKDRESSNVGANAAPLTPVNEEARPKDIPSETQDRRKGEGPNGEGSSDLPSSNENLQSTDEKEKPPITKDEEENENKPSTTRMKSSSSTMREETSEDETAEDVVRSPSGDRKDTENTMAFKCEICQKDTFKTERGLRIHKSKVHAKDRESSNVGASAAPLTPVNEEARPKDIPSATPDSRKGEGPNGEGSGDLPPSNEKLPSTDQKKKPPITKEVEENENKPSTTRMKSSSSATREETSEDETADDDVRSPTGNRKDKENTMVFKCEICQKDTFKTERGLRIHKSKVHAKDRESSNVGANAAPLTPVNEEARPKDIPSETPHRRKGEGQNGEGSYLPSSNEKLPSTDEKEKPPITKDVEENENKPSPTRMKSSSSTTREETSEDETADDVVRSPSGDRKDTENTMTFKCEICQKDTFKTERGLRIHKSKVHAKDRESSNVGASAAPLTPVNEEARPKDIPSATPDSRKGEGPNGEGSGDLPPSKEKLPSTDQKKKPPITKEVEENENKPSPTRMKSSSSATREETSEDETADDDVRSPTGNRKDKENTMVFKCEICQKDTFKTERGLRIHKSKVHAKDRESSNVGANAAPLTPVNEEARPKDIPSATPHRRKGEGQNGEGSYLPSSNEKLPSTDEKEKPPITKDVEENENKPSPTRMKSSSSTTREETSEDETADDVVRSPSGDRKDTENTMAFKCEICQRDNFKNEHGLRIHKSKVHAKDRESCNVGASAAPLTPVKEETRPKDIPSATGDETKSEGQNGGGSSDLPPSTEKLLSTDEKKKSPIMKDVEENENKPFTTKIKSSSSIKREETSEDETAEDDDKPPTGDRKDTGTEVVQQIRSAPDQRSNDEGQDVGGNNEDFAQSCTELDFSKYVAMQEACIKRSKHETEIRVERVNKFLKNLQYIMERTSDIPLDVLKSGSYYDKTKIDYDDEFDFMFYPKANMEADFTACPPGYCKIKKGRTTNNNLDSLCNENGYLDPNRFKEYMFNIFKDCIEDETFREGRRTRRKLRLVGSPAFTVLYDLGVVGVKPIEIDLVPAIKVEGWPQTAREISPQWLRDRNFEIATRCFHVVTKTFPEQHPDGDLLWRVSFSHAEQKLILHANQYDNGCRKEVFKLLKKLKENIKYESPSEIDKFCSYHLKMFMLNFYDNHNSFDMKQKETLFKQSIKELAICVRNGNIANYFIPEDNVLHFVSKEENNFVAERLQQLQEKFKL